MRRLERCAAGGDRGQLPLDDDARRLYELADGVASILGLAEICGNETRRCSIRLDCCKWCSGGPIYDKKQDGHCNLISALHKTVQLGPDAALYYLARMLVAGEDPLFLPGACPDGERDIGMADPQALPLAIAAHDAYEMLGSPEGELALASSRLLATAPRRIRSRSRSTGRWRWPETSSPMRR